MELLEQQFKNLNKSRIYLYGQAENAGCGVSKAFPLVATHPFRSYLQPLQHAEHCGFLQHGIQSPCSCINGALSFQKADQFLRCIMAPSLPAEKYAKHINDVPPSSMTGIYNLRDAFGLGNAKSAVNAAFDVGNCEGGAHQNVLFGTNGVISRTLTHWESVIRDLFDLVDKLRAELVKMREEMERAREEWQRQREEMEREKRAAEQKAQAAAVAAEQKAQAEAVAAAQKAQAEASAAEQTRVGCGTD